VQPSQSWFLRLAYRRTSARDVDCRLLSDFRHGLSHTLIRESSRTFIAESPNRPVPGSRPTYVHVLEPVANRGGSRRLTVDERVRRATVSAVRRKEVLVDSDATASLLPEDVEPGLVGFGAQAPAGSLSPRCGTRRRRNASRRNLDESTAACRLDNERSGAGQLHARRAGVRVRRVPRDRGASTGRSYDRLQAGVEVLRPAARCRNRLPPSAHRRGSASLAWRA
jgi:hypothetical protein